MDAIRAYRIMFQSAPALFRRENADARGDAVDFQVSIRSRLVQAGEHTSDLFPQQDRRFNPLPPCSGGRTHAGSCCCECSGVSIRSRLVQAGELGRCSARLSITAFQSAPALFRRENAPMWISP